MWASGRRPYTTPWVTYDGEPPTRTESTPWAEARFSTSLLRPDEDVRTAWVEPTQTPATPEPPIDFAAVFAENGTAPDWEPGGSRLHPVKLIRQELVLPTPADATARLTRARLFTSAQGVLDVTLDGTTVGDSVLAPGWTTYSQYAELDVHDVTAALTRAAVAPDGAAAPHVLGVRLADGWYAGRTGALGEALQYGDTLRAWWQLNLTYSDGTTAVLGPDATASSSRATTSPQPSPLASTRSPSSSATAGTAAT